jgi:hypothetical protein
VQKQGSISMAWEWSHTEDAYGFAEEQLRKMGHIALEDIASEWKQKLNDTAQAAWIEAQEDTFNLIDFHDPCVLDVLEASDGELADFIWQNASGHDHGRYCDNGGHSCGTHGCACIRWT